MSIPDTKTLVYDNCLALDSKGRPIFRCTSRKMEKYIEKKIAVRVFNYNELEHNGVFQFIKELDGKGHRGDPFFLEARPNKCAKCGTQDELTCHHIVPYSYHRHFPNWIHKYGTYNTIALCRHHHRVCEQDYLELRREIADRRGYPVGGVERSDAEKLSQAITAAVALKRHGTRMKRASAERLRSKIRDYLKIDVVRAKDLNELASTSRSDLVKQTHSEAVVKEILYDSENPIEALNDFCVMWRNRFLDALSIDLPHEFISDHWDPNRRFEP